MDKHTRTADVRETSHLGHSDQKTTKPKNNNKTRKTQREVRKQKKFSLKKTIIKVLEIRTDTTSTGGRAGKMLKKSENQLVINKSSKNRAH